MLSILPVDTACVPTVGPAVVRVSQRPTPTQSADAVRRAYESARSMRPFGLPLSPMNRVTLLLDPGWYDFGNTGLAIEAQYIDPIGIGSAQTLLTSTDASNNRGTIAHRLAEAAITPSSLTSSGTVATIGGASADWKAGDWIKVSGAFPDAYNGLFKLTSGNTYTLPDVTSSPATGTIRVQRAVNDTIIQGVTIRSALTTGPIWNGGYANLSDVPSAYFHDLGLYGQTLRDVVLAADENHAFSMRCGQGVVCNGNFERVRGGYGSFAGLGGTINGGRYTRCVGGAESFGSAPDWTLGDGINDGLFVDCDGDFGSWGGWIRGGTFLMCRGNFGCGTMGTGGISGGLFIVCNGEFATDGNLTGGLLVGCTGGFIRRQNDTSSMTGGRMICCVDTIGSSFSPGNFSGGELFYCVGGGGSFAPVGVYGTGVKAVGCTQNGTYWHGNSGGQVLRAKGVGTPYTVTTTAARVAFGTSSPALNLNGTIVGKWKLKAKVHLKYNGATFAAPRTVTLNLRRTNGTPGDLEDSVCTVITDVVTTKTGTLQVVDLPDTYYTITMDGGDSIEIQAKLDAAPTAGSLQIVEAVLIAEPMG